MAKTGLPTSQKGRKPVLLLIPKNMITIGINKKSKITLKEFKHSMKEYSKSVDLEKIYYEAFPEKKIVDKPESDETSK